MKGPSRQEIKRKREVLGPSVLAASARAPFNPDMPCTAARLGILLIALSASACVTERTVTDEAGNTIYRDTEFHTPWESEEKKRQEVMEKDRELGW